MSELPPPGEELAKRLMRKVDFEDRFVGIDMHGHKGNTKERLYSLESISTFVGVDDKESLQIHGSSASIRYVDFEELAEWLESVHGDQELADAIRREIAIHDNFKDEAQAVQPLLERRLEQATEVT
ncbi:hypothetical protein AArcCO_2287 [Halalkaliarchaeum sp. AArc-CO]|uniref:hypothetical protein n=1 Tax=Halalkaliarchaeum sp. AArc-CO TaxID=2866381 RepID=UPI00217EDBC3|nr:hypothetical protein [Halalkaliarchaeum sp. AArc-CO]UWG51581.1 hypothetical protein AArcCO_2287 [Halalkaliarchaeum sp. AArc-CO]